LDLHGPFSLPLVPSLLALQTVPVLLLPLLLLALLWMALLKAMLVMAMVSLPLLQLLVSTTAVVLQVSVPTLVSCPRPWLPFFRRAAKMKSKAM
jgi:hypothetical protein